MQNIVIIANGAAYGSESLFTEACVWPLRRASRKASSRFTCFDSRCRNRRVTRSKPAEGYNIQQMLEILTAQNAR